MPLKINDIQAKSIFTKSGLPGSDYVINPYNGCSFGCMYCYAAQIARWKHPNEVWSSYVDVKTNAPQVLKAELLKLERKYQTKNFGSVFFSSVTDPYQSIEARYHLTRQCLQVLAEFDYTGNIAIQTKSPLVINDVAVLQQLKQLSVGFTITALDDKLSQFLEVKAPPISSRLKALKQLHTAGIRTYAFIGPLLPHVVNNLDVLNQLLDTLENSGVSEIWFEHINLNPKIRARLYAYLQTLDPQLVPVFDQANTQEYREELDTLIAKAMQGRKLNLGLGKVIHHRNLPKKK